MVSSTEQSNYLENTESIYCTQRNGGGVIREERERKSDRVNEGGLKRAPYGFNPIVFFPCRRYKKNVLFSLHLET